MTTKRKTCLDNPIGYSRPLSAVYEHAMQELHAPFPSIRLGEGWTNFDKITGGLRMREFSILCGATGVGKTTLLANLSVGLMRAGARHYVASVETGDTDFAKRVMSVLHRKDLNTGDPVAEEELSKFDEKHGQLMAQELCHLAQFDNRIPSARLIDELAYHCEVKKCRVAMLDNLNFFMDTQDERKAIVEMDRVVHDLVILAKQVDMHIILVMHPRKTENGRVESEFDIKGSSTAVQEAHNVMLFNRVSDFIVKNDPNAHPRTHREIKFAKLRRRGSYAGSRLVLKNTGGSYGESGIFYEPGT